MAVLQQTVRFAASPRQVYDLYADPKKHAAAIGAPARFPRKAGGRTSAWDGYATGKVLELVPGKRIVQTWRTTEWKTTDPDSILILTFAPVAGGCELRMVHANVPDGQAASLRSGWKEHYWDAFRRHLRGAT